jgi:glycerophosphoryl diester phosphodiesterase
MKNAPESTLAAFESAIVKGADAIELDVHLSSDGELVVHHDFYLGRTNNGSGYIGDLTLSELKALDAGSWFSARFAGQRIPTLGEALELGRGKLRYEIDMKGTSLAFLKRIIDQVTRLDMRGQVELTSAHIPLLFQLKQIAPDLRTGTFFYPRPEWMGPALGQRHILDWMILSRFEVAHLAASLLTGEFVDLLWENGFLVHGSNLNKKEEISKGVALGIDQFSTDSLDDALNTVDDRDRPHRAGGLQR